MRCGEGVEVGVPLLLARDGFLDFGHGGCRIRLFSLDDLVSIRGAMD